MRRSKLVGGLALALAACSDAPAPSHLTKLCISDSGASRYYLHLDLSVSEGQFRYQFMGQDTFYRVKAMHVDGGEVTGLAQFESAATGEVRGSPVDFKYVIATGELSDGFTEFSCENLQDPSLLDLPTRESG